MQDELTLLAYIVVFIAIKSAGSLLALLVFVGVSYTSFYAVFNSPVDDVYLFLCFGVVYSICAIFSHRRKEAVWMGYVFMSLYCLYYSYDSWINAGHETWIWQHHEVFIFIAHVTIMLLLSKVRFTLVFTSLVLLYSHHCSGESNESREGINHS